MIKLRVEWRHDCPSCGTQFVTDFLDEAAEANVCPWCGLADGSDPYDDIDVRDYVLTAVGQIEQAVNDKARVPG